MNETSFAGATKNVDIMIEIDDTTVIVIDGTIRIIAAIDNSLYPISGKSFHFRRRPAMKKSYNKEYNSIEVSRYLSSEPV